VTACGSEAPGPVATPDDPAPAAGRPAAPQTGPAPAQAPTGAPYPIVLLHGMGGFGRLTVGPIGVQYFNGVVEDLSKRGESVFVTVSTPYDTSEVRAREIAKQIDAILQKTGKAKVNLIGHSQGGLDARVLASPAGMAMGDRIASVTTIATPHRGSRVADLALGLLKDVPKSIIDDVTSSFLRAVEKTAYELQSDPKLRAQVTELSETYMQSTFNPKYVDDGRVLYMSYGGRTNNRTGIGVCDDAWFANDPTDLDTPQIFLAPMASYLEEGKLKANDGLVTVESSKWGVFMQCVAADHMKEVGQVSVNGAPNPDFDHLAMFRAIVDRIRARGL
jgi:triacylglycerol lipase